MTSSTTPTTPPVPSAAPDAKDPTTWSPDALARLQAILDGSRRTAGQAVLDTFDHAERRLDAAAFVAFWNETRLKAMATCGADGVPHVAPVHADFIDGRLRSTIYETAQRRRDLQTNPRVSFTTWGPNGAAAIVHGIAREIPDSLRDTRPGAAGRPRRTVGLEIEVTRIYAMRGRDL